MYLLIQEPDKLMMFYDTDLHSTMYLLIQAVFINTDVEVSIYIPLCIY